MKPDIGLAPWPVQIDTTASLVAELQAAKEATGWPLKVIFELLAGATELPEKPPGGGANFYLSLTYDTRDRLKASKWRIKDACAFILKAHAGKMLETIKGEVK